MVGPEEATAGQMNEPGEAEARVYINENDWWEAILKPSGAREYCYLKNPGVEHFHLLMIGEIYLQKGHEKCCLNCALRHGIATRERLHWQHPTRFPKSAAGETSES